MIDTDYKNVRLNLRNELNQIKASRNTYYESDIRTTSPNKSSKNRSKSFEIIKTQKSNNPRINSTRNSSKKMKIHSVDLRREIEDPANDGVKDEIERVMHFYKQIEQLKNDFNVIEK